MTDTAKPLPAITPLSKPFWDAAGAGRLAVQHCDDCGMLRFPPLPRCDICGNERTSWVTLSGRGSIWAKCEFHRAYLPGFAAELPYNVVLIALEEGPRLYSNLVGTAFADIVLVTEVVAVFVPATDAVTLVKFRLAG